MGERRKIISNKVQCNTCGDIIESKQHHQFVCCRCFRESGGTTGTFVDGGLDYLRRGGAITNYTELSETEGMDNGSDDIE